MYRHIHLDKAGNMDKPTPLIRIDRFELGSFATNCFVIGVEGSTDCWLVDVGEQPGRMLDHIRRHELQPRLIVLTHGHADHIAGLPEALSAFPNTPVLIHQHERNFLTDPALNLSLYFGTPLVCPEATRLLQGNETLELVGVPFHVLHTPGHSPGGITLHQPDHHIALVGDTLFAGSIGRYDFPTSDGPTLFRSIHGQLLRLSDDTCVYPGHGPDTTIGREQQSNPYLAGQSFLI
jgi:glyoxylase-like metal-dependent hydrolase (beta-lactamase superfamily II)